MPRSGSWTNSVYHPLTLSDPFGSPQMEWSGQSRLFAAEVATGTSCRGQIIREGDMAEFGQVDPVLRVTVGVPVYTDDAQRLGTVKEIRGRNFKVGTGLFQKDFWLSADPIDTVVAGEPIVLAIPKDRLDPHKL